MACSKNLLAIALISISNTLRIDFSLFEYKIDCINFFEMNTLKRFHENCSCSDSCTDQAIFERISVSSEAISSAFQSDQRTNRVHTSLIRSQVEQTFFQFFLLTYVVATKSQQQSSILITTLCENLIDLIITIVSICWQLLVTSRKV